MCQGQALLLVLLSLQSEFLGAENIGRLREIETGPYGGDGGEWFTDWWESLDGTDYEPKHPPQQINIRAGGRVDQITMFYGGWRGRPHGGEGGALHRLRLYEGDRIIRVAGRRGIGPGAGIDQITLYTLNGKQFGPYGGTGGVGFDSGNFTARSCYLGFISGKAGQRLDQLSLHWLCPWGEQEFQNLQPHQGRQTDTNQADRSTCGLGVLIFVITLLTTRL